MPQQQNQMIKKNNRIWSSKSSNQIPAQSVAPVPTPLPTAIPENAQIVPYEPQWDDNPDLDLLTMLAELANDEKVAQVTPKPTTWTYQTNWCNKDILRCSVDAESERSPLILLKSNHLNIKCTILMLKVHI